MGNKIHDDLWAVISETEMKYRGKHISQAEREMVEKKATVTLFDGGCFLSYGPEFDLFVLPERRGKWKIRGTIRSFVDTMIEKYGYAKVKIHKKNKVSMRLAIGFKFMPVADDGSFITLEAR